MIAHLRGRDRKLELHGWTGQDAEWIALVCLHSGVFTRARQELNPSAARSLEERPRRDADGAPATVAGLAASDAGDDEPD